MVKKYAFGRRCCFLKEGGAAGDGRCSRCGAGRPVLLYLFYKFALYNLYGSFKVRICADDYLVRAHTDNRIAVDLDCSHSFYCYKE